jgi:hypothetical protein
MDGTTSLASRTPQRSIDWIQFEESQLVAVFRLLRVEWLINHEERSGYQGNR